MPGNERGDRIHNFFGQENLSQSQHLPQVVDEAWPGVGNNFWHGSQRQIAASAIPNVKNHNVPQTADSDERHGSSSLHQGLSFSQPIPRPEFSRNRTQVQQPTLNGYVQGHQMFHNRQNEANLLGMDTEPDGRNLTSRGFSVHESQPQLGNGLEFHKKSSGFTDYTESPVNYDFFGGQQQLGTQQPGMLQSLQRQQSGISEMQLLEQQQFMLRQMQDVQRQQQFQKQQEMRQMTSFVKQQPGVGHSSSSALINGIPVQDLSNYSWQPDLVSANTNWLQRNVSSAVQGSSSGHMFSPGQGDMPPLVGAVPAQVDQSLYGAPVSGNGVPQNRFPMLQMDKPNSQQISGGSSSFSGNQYVAFSEQLSYQDGNAIMRQGHQGKNLIASPASQGLGSGFDMEHLQRVSSQQNGLLHEFHERQDLDGTLQSSQEKAISQISPPQKVATLDPTEERILFGSDDNLWDSFGKDAGIASGGFNILDGADMSGPSPSLLSGSWSALMQSAVAETSTDNMGTREEWSGLTSLPSEPTTKDQRNQISSNGDKQQLTWANNGFQTPPLNSGLSSLSGNACANRNQSTTSGQGGVEAYENNRTVQMGASQQLIQQFPGEGTKWMQAEPGHDFGKVLHSNSRTNVKTGSGSWLSQQNHPFYNNATSSQHPDRANGLNFHDSAAPSAVDGLQNKANENASQTSQNIEQRSPMLNLMGHSGTAWKVGSISGSGTEMEHPKYAAGSPRVSRGSSDLNNNASMPDSRMSVTSRDGSQQLGNNDNIDVWKHVSSSMTTQWTGFPGNSQPDTGKYNQTLELSRNNSLSNGTLDRHDLENSHANEKTENSVGSRENDVSDSSCLPGVKQKSSTSQSGRKPSVGRKFQYHPMGDVDVDVQPNHGTKRATMSQSMMQQVSQQLKTNDRGYPSHSKSSRHTAWNSLETEKLHSGLSGLPRETRGLDGAHEEDLLSGTRPSTFAQLDEAVHSPAPHGSTPLSQNVLQLFHKMEQSKELGNARQISSTNGNFSSEVPETSASEVTLPLQHNQSSAQQGFGLQLGISSQQLLSHEHSVSSQTHSEAANHLRETHTASSRGERDHMWLAASTFPSLPHNVSGSLRNNVQQNVGTSFLPGFPYSRSQHHNQHIADIRRQVADTQAVNMSYNKHSSNSEQMEPFWRHQPNQSTMASVPDFTRSTQQEANEMSHPRSHSRDTAPEFPVLDDAMTADHCRMPVMLHEGVTPKDFSVACSSLSAGQQHSSGQFSNSYSDVYMPDVKTMKNSETTSSHSHNEEDQTQKDGVIQSESDTLGMQLQSIAKEQPGKGDAWTQINPGNHLASVATTASQGKELAVGLSAAASISGTPISQREIGIFGPSLKPNFSLPHSFSSIRQVQGMENAEVDHSSRTTKKLKGVDGILDAQSVASQGGQELLEHKVVREGLPDEKLVSCGEPMTLNFSSRITDGHIANALSADTNPLGPDDCPNLAGGSNRTSDRYQQSQVSPQMAPSWFDRYGTLKNKQILSTYDAQKLVTKASHQPVPFGSPTDVNPVERENSLTANANLSAAVHKSPISTENISSSQLLDTEVASQALVLKRPKKRKTATSDLIPWHREVTSIPQRLQTISSAEVDWSKAVNRLAEKVEETDTVDDIPPLLRLKRRLVLTTQLMQLLLHPPTMRALFDDAILNCETVIYLVGRSTLGYACGMLGCYGDSMSSPASVGKRVHDEPKISKKIKDQYFRKVREDLVDRARKLEDDLLRLDKRMSVLDLRVECQDLERFAVINRFAKFHGRGQADAAETSSSSDAPTNFQKYFPQRYVTALPMPRNLPDRVQCFSL